MVGLFWRGNGDLRRLLPSTCTRDTFAQNRTTASRRPKRLAAGRGTTGLEYDLDMARHTYYRSPTVEIVGPIRRECGCCPFEFIDDLKYYVNSTMASPFYYYLGMHSRRCPELANLPLYMTLKRGVSKSNITYRRQLWAGAPQFEILPLARIQRRAFPNVDDSNPIDGPRIISDQRTEGRGRRGVRCGARLEYKQHHRFEYFMTGGCRLHFRRAPQFPDLKLARHFGAYVTPADCLGFVESLCVKRDVGRRLSVYKLEFTTLSKHNIIAYANTRRSTASRLSGERTRRGARAAACPTSSESCRLLNRSMHSAVNAFPYIDNCSVSLYP
ncbi:hypothetical protein EVAR_66342_1 [Eumeta japonica]|uniref:Uncharacterized protein n=1 Tax=Eumeta variegata TaxID=151549 RepID=A0A4C2A3L1_EUMVA|nr:hypothetical protein EVAR_66342_1 [Eumeta japonica]